MNPNRGPAQATVMAPVNPYLPVGRPQGLWAQIVHNPLGMADQLFELVMRTSVVWLPIVLVVGLGIFMVRGGRR